MQSRKQIRAKKKKEREDGDGDVRVEGDDGFSIHPGPGELVHRGLRPLEAQSLPKKHTKLGSFKVIFDSIQHFPLFHSLLSLASLTRFSHSLQSVIQQG